MVIYHILPRHNIMFPVGNLLLMGMYTRMWSFAPFGGHVHFEMVVKMCAENISLPQHLLNLRIGDGFIYFHSMSYILIFYIFLLCICHSGTT